MTRLIVNGGQPLQGTVSLPGDKSISHRALLLGALAEGESMVRGFLAGSDCLATLACVQALGVPVVRHNETTLTVQGRGLRGMRPPDAPLNCVRSGTTMRLLSGILAGGPFAPESAPWTCMLTGEPQLLRRPMRRITEPLRAMGADIADSEGHAPLSIRPAQVRGMEHHLAVASAQVKSAILLAGLYADGPTTVVQPGPARDHTERMLAAMGAQVVCDGLAVRLAPGATLAPGAMLAPFLLTVPGDISSAAFPLVAALLLPGSRVVLEGVGVNATRTGLLDVLEAMGARLRYEELPEQSGEPLANVEVSARELHGTVIAGHTVVRMIDEFPILAVAATQAQGETRVRDAAELRVKETDRIATVVTELRKLGAQIEAQDDGFVVEGPTSLQGGVVDSHGDHRLGMALAVAGLVATGEVIVERAECIADSFPAFVPLMHRLGADITVAGGAL